MRTQKYEIYKFSKMDKHIRNIINKLETSIKKNDNIKNVVMWYRDLLINIEDFINEDINQIGEIFFKSDRLTYYDNMRTSIRNQIKKTYGVIVPYSKSYYSFPIYITRIN